MQVNYLESTLKNLRMSIGDAVWAFGGQPTKHLLKALNNKVYSNRFHRPPIGPLGLYLNLKDDRSPP